MKVAKDAAKTRPQGFLRRNYFTLLIYSILASNQLSFRTTCQRTSQYLLEIHFLRIVLIKDHYITSRYVYKNEFIAATNQVPSRQSRWNVTIKSKVRMNYSFCKDANRLPSKADTCTRDGMDWPTLTSEHSLQAHHYTPSVLAGCDVLHKPKYCPSRS